ncbi:Zinc finger, GRF-type [Sesbania bispinosa]|nr:Zinc finger, GRF-type [Sesbania bispinosa]
MKPEPRKTVGTQLKMCGSKTMDSSSSSLRVCRCGQDVLVLTSNSLKNPGRRFFRCPNWKTTDSCRFFQWVDEEIYSNESLNQIPPPNQCDRCADVVEASNLKVKDMQKKLAYETKKMNLFLTILLVLSWMVMCIGFLMGKCVNGL